MSLPVAKLQYWAVTPSNTAQTNGPAQRLYVTGAGSLVLTSGDGSSFTISLAANSWTPIFVYPIQIIGTGSGATGIIAEGYGAPTTGGVLP